MHGASLCAPHPRLRGHKLRGGQQTSTVASASLADSGIHSVRVGLRVTASEEDQDGRAERSCEILHAPSSSPTELPTHPNHEEKKVLVSLRTALKDFVAPMGTKEDSVANMSSVCFLKRCIAGDVNSDDETASSKTRSAWARMATKARGETWG